MAWTTLTFPFGSILTSLKMTQMYNNFQAMADNDTGAPDMVAGAMRAANFKSFFVPGTYIPFSQTSGSQSITGGGGTYTLPERILAVWGHADMVLEVFINGAWRTLQSGLNTTAFALQTDDATSYRVQNNNISSQTLYYLRWV